MSKPSKYDDLLSRWLRGETDRREERELERLAQEDPFLAEALEGYRRQPEGAQEETLARLREQLKTGEDRRRSMVFYLNRIAAALVVLLIAAAGLWLVNQPEGSERVAQEMEQPRLEPAPLSPSPSAGATEEAATEPEAAAAEEPAFPRSKPQARKRTGPPPEPREQAPLPPPPTAYTQLDEPDIALEEEAPSIAPTDDRSAALKERTAGQEVQEDKAAPSAGKILPSVASDELSEDRAFTPRREGANEREDPWRPRRISGRVIDEQTGDPLIGASLLVPSTGRGTVTDIDGNFQIVIPAGAEQLSISYTGFTNKEIDLSPADTVLEIQLDPGAPLLDEVVVTGLAIEKKQQENSSVAVQSKRVQPAPQPRGGFERLEKYIRRNRGYPAAAQENDIEGNVLLEFTVDDRGRPQQIKVLRSLGYGCDEEAVRLIEEGPPWKNAAPGEKIRYAITFGKDE